MSSDDTLAIVLQGLTPKQAAFARAFAENDLDLQRAEQALEWSPGVGRDYLSDPTVRRAITALSLRRDEREADIRAGTLGLLWQLTTAWDPARLIGADGTPLPPHELPPELRAALKGVEYRDGVWKYTFVDRSAIALNLLKHFQSSDKKQEKEKQGDTDEKTTVLMIAPDDPSLEKDLKK